MQSEFSNRLTNRIEQIRRKQKLERDLVSVQKSLGEANARLELLKGQLKKEEVDVVKLEGTNLTALFYSVLGSREQQLEKERQELLSAQLKYQNVERQVALLAYDQQFLQERLAELANVEAEYETILSEKEDYLHRSNHKAAAELIKNAEQIAGLESDEKEIDEAVTAGSNVISSLNRVIESLQSAKGWGTWDMLGGGLLSTAIKHNRIDDARDEIDEVQPLMSRFSRELADVQNQIDLQVNIGEFETFADYFFDGLIVDWVVQSKITESLAQVETARSNISDTVDQLEDFKNEIQKKRTELRNQRVKLIEQA
jgi:hypothetical protein